MTRCRVTRQKYFEFPAFNSCAPHTQPYSKYKKKCKMYFSRTCLVAFGPQMKVMKMIGMLARNVAYMLKKIANLQGYTVCSVTIS